MRGQAAALLVVAGLSGVQAQFKCDGLWKPNWDACDEVMAGINWENNDYYVEDQQCQFFANDATSTNCIIGACNYAGDGKRAPLSLFTGQSDYAIVKSQCKASGLGGEAAVGSPRFIQVLNNPDYVSPSRVKRAALGHVTSTTLTKEEAEALKQRARQGNQVTGLEARADKQWISTGVSENVRKNDKRDRMSAVASPGSSQQWSNTQGFSTSVSVSVSAGFDFEIFSASMDVTTTFEESVSYTYTLSFDPSARCDPAQDAVLYMYPLFTKYDGFYSDDPDQTNPQQYEVWVPIKGENNYSLDVECLG